MLTRINGSIDNVRSKNITDDDSLRLKVDTYLMDTALVNLSLNQSYLDTARGFTMKMRMAPTSLSMLNPVTVPLSNIYIKSGQIDSFYLEAIARENFATGKIKMYYEYLRVKMVKDGDINKSGLKEKLVSFIANTFIIKNKNKEGQNILFLPRHAEKSFFSYLLKIIMNGMSSAIGVESSRKNKKSYLQELEKRNLEPLFENTIMEKSKLD